MHQTSLQENGGGVASLPASDLVRLELALPQLSSESLQAWLPRVAGQAAWSWLGPQLSCVAWGVAVRRTFAGREALAEAQASCSELSEQLGHSGRTIAPGLPFTWVGCRFAGRGGGAWEAWPQVELVVPRFLLFRQQERAGLLAVTSLEEEALTRETLGRVAEAVTQRLSDPSQPQPPALVALAEDEAAWCGRVEQAQGAIAAGQLEKIVLARATRHQLPDGWRWDAAASLLALRRQNPGAVSFLWRGPGRECFLGASPELLVRLTGRRVESEALAGTAPRDPDPTRDRALGKALQQSTKDVHEHTLAARAIEAALSPLCSHLRAASEPVLRRLSGVQHLATPLRGQLREECHLLELVARLHPTPALGGWPREPALAYLSEHELLVRGRYGAPFGWMDGQGSGEFRIAIRSALLQGRRATLFAGAGIVSDSDPEAEWRETELKLSTAQQGLRAVPEAGW